MLDDPAMFAKYIIIVDEGLIGVKRNGVLVAELCRGDVFVLQPGASVEGLEVVHLPGTMLAWKYCLVPLSNVKSLPRELWKQLAATSRVYDGASSSTRAYSEAQIARLLTKTSGSRRR